MDNSSASHYTLQISKHEFITDSQKIAEAMQPKSVTTSYATGDATRISFAAYSYLDPQLPPRAINDLIMGLNSPEARVQWIIMEEPAQIKPFDPRIEYYQQMHR
jgi:hypothetical protein